jgi:hypothetical protein
MSIKNCFKLQFHMSRLAYLCQVTLNMEQNFYFEVLCSSIMPIDLSSSVCLVAVYSEQNSFFYFCPAGSRKHS